MARPPHSHVAHDEAVAHADLATDDPADRHHEHAHTWAGDAEARFRTLDTMASGAGLFADSYGPEGQNAVAGIKDVIDGAATVTAAAHTAAGLPVPEKI